MSIIKKATRISKLCRGKPPLRFDTTLKIPVEFWESWGIDRHGIHGRKERKIEEARIKGYEMEWEGLTEECLAMIKKTSEQMGLGDSNNRMNKKIAEEIIKVPNIVGEVIKDLKIMDIGCGEGASDLAVLEEFKNREIDYHPYIFLLDPSEQYLPKAYQSVKNFMRINGIKGGYVDKFEGLVEDKLKEQHFCDVLSLMDIVIFNASLHHMDVYKVLAALRKYLPDHAVIGFGDWCHHLVESPGNFRWLIIELDEIQPGLLAEYDELFGFECGGGYVPIDNSTRTMIDWWVKLAENFKEANLEPFFSPLEGHMPRKSWETLFTQFGFQLISGPHFIIPDNQINTVALFQNTVKSNYESIHLN